MIGKKVEKLMNEQIVNELYSAYLYLAMSAYFDLNNLKGMAHWMRCQAQEEEVHAMKFYKHIVERCGRVDLGKIDAPPKEWKSALDAFKAAYDHEVKVTNLINKIVEASDSSNDYASRGLLQWFTNEQIEEEAQTDEIVKQLEIIGDRGAGLLMLDRHIGKREFKYPEGE
jgi:ferritin